MAERPLRLLVVEDDHHLGPFLMRCASGWGYVVQLAETLGEAVRQLLWLPDLVLLDIHLPDGSGMELAERASGIRPAPRILATTGAASTMETFNLGSLGVRGLIEKPFRPQELKAALLRAWEPPRDPFQQIGACVGHASLREVQRGVRKELLAEALARTGGNLSQTARLLGVTRQAVQYLLADR